MSVLKINSLKLGDVEYKESDLITLSTPLLGFNELNDFLMISNETSYPFIWFQSVEDPTICFILVETIHFFPDYQPDIPKRELKVLASDDLSTIKIFAIVVIPDNPLEATLNLRAPLIVNLEKKLAKQIILDNDTYQIKQLLFTKTD